VEFVVGKVALAQVFLPFGIVLFVSFHQWSKLLCPQAVILAGAKDFIF
jgi:hypothetical protein